MRVLYTFGAQLLVPRGTPSRARNLAVALGRRKELDLYLMSGDPSDQVEAELGLPHTRCGGPGERGAEIAQRALELEVELVYGHTHKALVDLAQVPRHIKRVVDIHGHLAAEQWEQRWRWLPARASRAARTKWNERRYLPQLDGATTASFELGKRCAAYGLPVETIWGGVDCDHFRPKNGPISHEDGLVVAYAGNLLPYQGVGVLLESLEQLWAAGESFHLRLIGDAGKHEKLRSQLAARVREGNATLIPPVPYAEVPSYLDAADILVVPRPWSRTAHYGFPSKLPEYMAMGKPVIATRVGDQRLVIEDGETGILVSPNNSQELSSALQLLKDRGVRARLGQAARQVVTSRFQWEAAADKTLKFWQQIAC